MKIELKCVSCNKLFITDFKHRDKKFCDKHCYFDYARKNKLFGKTKDPSVREIRTCVQCGNPFEERKKHQKKICSDECRTIWNSNPKNIELRITKSKNACTERYGVDSLFKTKHFKESYKNIFMEKYGVESPMLVPKFVEKLKTTVRDKHLITLIPKLNENNLELLDTYKTNKSGSTSQPYIFKCLKCDNIFSSTLLGSGKIPICRKCYPMNKNSKLEQIIKDYLNSLNIIHIDGDRKILDGKEIDIYLPDYKIGIEINGNYYHSEISGEKTKNYHIDKTKLCYEKGITLIQFYEDEILLKEDIILSKLKNKLHLSDKIFARKCEIKEISKKESTLFLTNNHLQGNSIDKVRFGLFYNDELVSVMTFGKKRKSLGNGKSDISEYELVRFCNKINLTIIGGFSKLLKNFIKKYNPSKIETFADIRWSGLDQTKTVYYKNGFNFVKQTPPNYWYINTERYLHRSHRFSFRKDVLIKEGYSKELTEWEIMQLKKYDRIWDCGSLKFEMILS